jgi:ATP-dependent protease ClpP protease subunit
MVTYVTSSNGETADLNLSGAIGSWFGVNGTEFADTIKNLATQGTVKRIRVRINSVGGSILDGYHIFAAINAINSDNTTYKGCYVDTYIDGLAASTAGWVALAGKKVYMLDYARVMLHNPYSNKENLSTEDRKTLNALKESIVEIFKNRTKKTEQEIAMMMDNCTFLKADECLNFGFIDEIVSTDKNKNEFDLEFSDLMETFNLYTKKDTEQTPKPAQIESPEQEIIINNFNTQNNSQMDLSNIAKALNLNEGAKETDIISAINSLRAYESLNKEYVKRIENLNAENSALKDDAKKIEDAKCDALINQAIKDKKLKESEKEHWLEIAKLNYLAAENALKSMGQTSDNNPRLSQQIKNDNKSGDKTWSFVDYLKNDANALETMKEENAEMYAQLYKNEYGILPVLK